MPDSVPELVGPVLEKICEAASGRKFTKLRHEAKQMLTNLEEVFKPPSEAGGLPEQRRVVLHMNNADDVEAAAKAEQERLAALDAAGAAVANGAPDAAPLASTAAAAADDDEVVRVAFGPDGTLQLSVAPAVPGAAATGDGDTAGLPVPAGAASGEPGAQVQPEVVSVAEHPSFKGSMSLQAAQDLMEVLRLAVESRKVPLVDLALDLVQKLLAHRHIRGPVYSISHRRDPGGKAGGRRARPTEEEDELDSVVTDTSLPQATAIELMCRCDDIADEGVELRVLKGLLTAVTSTTVHVHGQALLLAVRTCYNTFLLSRSEVNQTTAKASLTQMLNLAFQRMEARSETAWAPAGAVSDQLGLPPADASSVTAFVNSFLHDVVSTVDPFGFFAEGVQQQLDDAFVEGDASSQGGTTEVESPVGAPPAAQQPQGAAAAPGEAAGAAELKAGDALPAEPGRPPLPVKAMGQAAMDSILQKDVYLVFRALCKLSTRSADGAAGADLTALRGKVLALELLKILLENSGPVFRHGERFVAAIKQHLCLSLLKNATGPLPQAQALSCSIFLTLLAKFRGALKAEVGVFFPMILLRAVEPGAGGAPAAGAGGGQAAPPADAAHKAVVVRCLEAVCDDGQLLVDVFVNYDCDLEGANLFERLVLALVRTAQGSQEKEGPAAAPQTDDLSLRLSALGCLVRTLRALVEWHTQTAPQPPPAPLPAAAAAAGGEPSEGVQRDWGQLQSLPSAAGGAAAGGEASAGAPASGAGSPRQAAAARQEAPHSQASLLASLSASVDEVQAQLRDADPAREAQLLESWKAYKKGFQEGVAAFNQKPRKGVAFLQEAGMLGREPREVAKFLAKTAGLNKTQIGEFLGERDEACLRVMHAYVNALDFGGREFDAAIRMFLDGFRLPGEAQKIDRLVEKFAERFVHCNPEAFRSADVAYVLAYSVVMLNTDAHNPQVKTKMTKQDFLRNNRGINDGADLPEDYLGRLYDSIVSDEIKMKDSALDMLQSQQHRAAGSWMDTILNLIPGRKQAAANEPSEEAIRRTHDFLRERAKGATFFEAREGETARPMLDVAWAPMLGAFSVLFEEFADGVGINMCLAGLVAAVRMTSLLGMAMLRDAFVTSICRLTLLHAPAQMQVKNARAFRALLVAADENGDHLHETWQDVLRCVSRWELLQTVHAGGPSDAAIFGALPAEGPGAGARKRAFFSLPALRGGGAKEPATGKAGDGFSSVGEVPLHAGGRAWGAGKQDAAELTPPDAVIQEIDAQELNRVFVHSERLDSEAIVEFVRALVVVAEEELQPAGHPRVFSLAKIVEISHFNMARIRLVWNRIWAVLSDFFVHVGCHRNLQVAMYAVDSLRQLAMKFLERDELANYSFQTAFLTPLVVVMRQSRALEIRELIIRCVSQMVLARVGNVKSGWKSMFMVFTTAAADESQQIVRLAFETIEKIVREHFDYIIETEVTTFTDCVNCLIAFTNNPHSLDVALNAIAFLRFCAMKLAEGALGEVEELPEGSRDFSPSIVRIRPSGQVAAAERQATEPSTSAPDGGPQGEGGGGGGQSSDRDEHIYFWFPLLAGLSELTFDPRKDIRYSALEVLFDTLKFHGAAFSTPFWTRVFDSVLLPIFDHVRAEVTDTTTFTAEERRAEVDAWLYETCTQCLQHMVDLVARFQAATLPLLGRLLELLSNFIRRPHQSLASVGVAALVRLAVGAGGQWPEPVWEQVLATLAECTAATLPDVASLAALAAALPAADAGDVSPAASPRLAGRPSDDRRQASLAHGAGARRLHLTRTRAGIQLLLVQACGEVWAAHGPALSQGCATSLLDTLAGIEAHVGGVDADKGLRRALAEAQQRDQVPEARALPDPPLLRLENEAGRAHLSMLRTLHAAAPADVAAGTRAEARLLGQCSAVLQRFEELGNRGQDGEGALSRLASVREEAAARGGLAVAALHSLGELREAAFRAHLPRLFPLLTRLIACRHAPPEMHAALAELFAGRVGRLLLPAA